jgi:hypothetical protein
MGGQVVTESLESDLAVENGQVPSSLGTAAARNLATTTKSVPQMQGISSRWLLRVMPWVEVSAGTYRVNRRVTYGIGTGRVSFTSTGDTVRVIPPTLAELPWLRGFDDAAALTALADRCTQREFSAGEAIVEAGRPVDGLYLIAHGKINKVGTGKYGTATVLDVLGDGNHFGDQTVDQSAETWDFTAQALTAGTLLVLSKQAIDELVGASESLRAQVDWIRVSADLPQNVHGEADIEVASGHSGEPALPDTFVDYELSPREYELSVAQTVLRVHTRVADLYSQPMDQVQQQLRLTVEALRERQEHELVNNREFGLLHNAEPKQRIHTRSGPPTPDDFDELITRRRGSRLLLAHPQAIAAFGRECTKRGIDPTTTTIEGTRVRAWRGIPLLPCNKIPITDGHTTSVLVLRTGVDNDGVIGLHQPGIPHEHQPSMSVRFMGIDDKGVLKYLVTLYYSVAVLVPDALGVLENVELGR